MKIKTFLTWMTIATVALAMLVWLRPRPTLHVENFSRVKTGMSQSEVENLLGGPPGNYGRGGPHGMMTMEGSSGPYGSIERLWFNDSSRFEIYFDVNNRVVGIHKRAGYRQTPPESVLLQWLKKKFVF